MTQLSEQLVPAFESSVQVVAEGLALPGVQVGQVVPVDDPAEALPVGSVRRIRGTVADEAGLDVVLALTDVAALQVCITAGSGYDLVGALLPTVNAVLATVGANLGIALELANLVEMGTNETLGGPGIESFTAGLFVGDDQVGNLMFLAVSGVPAGAEAPATADYAGAAADLDGVFANPLSLLRGVEMRVTAELGRTRLPVSHVLDLGPGAVVELDRVAGSPVDVLVNGTVIARGEVVVIDEEYGVRITEIVGTEDD